MTYRQRKILLKFKWWLSIRFLTLLSDLTVIACAWVGSFWLRYNLSLSSEIFKVLLSSTLIAMVVQLGTLIFFRVYRITARFVSIDDLKRIVEAAAVGVFLTFAVLFAWNRLEGIPRALPLLDIILLVLGLGGTRALYRMLREGVLIPRKSGIRTLIVGAGSGGEQLLRALRNGDGEYNPVGFLDDSRSKAGKTVAGVKVLGRIRELPEIVKQYNIELSVLAIPSADKKLVQRFVELCIQAGVSYKTLPSTTDLLSGKLNADSVRDVTIEDLLGRDPVKLDWTRIQAEFSGRRVMVTGAGGSIGSELCRQLIKLAPSRLILIENSEFALYQIEQELQKHAGSVDLVPVLCDVRDSCMVESVLNESRPEIVFHAAAYKHVPMVEMNPRAGIKTNVFGTFNLAQAAINAGVRKFVMISTDKAVNPTNIMGATKRVAEIYCQNLNGRTDGTVFVTTRFGNVLGSSGSVVPLFQRQIAEGGPVTVTHKDIERFFMTIPEACQLVLQAAAMGQGGEIFVLDMGEPVKIDHLARQLIKLSGLEPDRDIQIVYTGLRPGEKLYEELFHENENLSTTPHSKILLSTARNVNWQQLQHQLKRLQKACKRGDLVVIRQCLKDIVPEYIYEPELYSKAA